MGLNDTLLIGLHISTAEMRNEDQVKWAACESKLGIVVFAQTEETAHERVKEAVGFTLDAIRAEGDMEDVRRYLTHYGVEYDFLFRMPSSGNDVCRVTRVEESALLHAAS